MRDRLRLPLALDADALRRDLEHLEGAAWIDHFVKQNYEGSWSILPLRAPAGASHPIQTTYSDPAKDDYVDTPVLDACPAFRSALEQFHCDLLAVRLMKLTPGSEIRTHSDHDLSVEDRRVRLHIPIATNPDVDFRLNDRRIVMAEGECWYLRLSDPHTVINRGATDRIHLVIDAVVNDWLEGMLRQANEGGAAGDFSGAAGDPARGPSGNLESPENRGRDRPRLHGYVPTRVEMNDEGASGARATSPASHSTSVRWCFLGDITFTEPFFEQTLKRRDRGHPIHRTSIEELLEWSAISPGLPPTAFIFHVSRCGSTLLSQLAAALPETVVISEAPPIDDVLRAHIPDDDRIALLRAVISGLGQPRRGNERHFFVKLDAWHALEMPVIRRAFPEVPFLFLYRDPAEVIASHMRQPGMHMVPGIIDPSLLGLDLQSALRMEREQYCARILGLIYSAGLEYAKRERITLMDYAQLPDAASTMLLDWCGITPDSAILEALRRVSEADAKSPSLPFAADASIRPLPTERAKTAAQAVQPMYEELESRRRGESKE